MTTKKERQAEEDQQMEEWRVEQAQIKQRRTMSKLQLQPEQLEALEETDKALESAVNEIAECNDLWLSTINKLVSAYWSLRNTFDLGENLIQEDED